MIACVLLPIGIGYLNREGSDVETVAVIDQTGRYGSALVDTDLYHFMPLRGDTVADPHKFYADADGRLAAVVVIPNDIDSVHQLTIYSDKTINASLKMSLGRQLSDTITRAHVASYGVPNLQRMIDESSVNVDVKSVKWTDDGTETETSTEIAMGIGREDQPHRRGYRQLVQALRVDDGQDYRCCACGPDAAGHLDRSDAGVECRCRQHFGSGHGRYLFHG